MDLKNTSEYNRDQWRSFCSIQEALARLHASQIEKMSEAIKPYLHFREALDRYHSEYFDSSCRKACFETKLSACCGFESIFTFFADQVISALCSTTDEIDYLLQLLEKPNTSGQCVYLTEKGCSWKIRPISCAMFLCEEAKQGVFDFDENAKRLWNEFQSREKEFTYPIKAVLFDDLEKAFIDLGVESCHMYFHRSPGLLRLKKRSGLK